MTSLTTRLVVLLVVYQVFLVAAVTLSFTDTFDNHLAQEKLTRKAEFELLLNTAIAPDLFTRNYAAIQEFLVTVKQQKPDLEFVQVTDSDGNTVADSGHGLEPPFPLPQPALSYTGNHQLRLGSEPVGTVRYAVSYRELQALKRNLISHFTLIVGTLAVLGAVMLYFLTRYLTKGLTQLHDASTRLATGKGLVPLEVRSRDQIGQLTERFNEMIGAVSQCRSLPKTAHKWRIGVMSQEEAVALQRAAEQRQKMISG